jgi:hypothetical protein
MVNLPGGTAATDSATADELLWITNRDPPGTLMWVADRPSFYLPLAVRSPLYLDASVPSAQTTVDNARRAVAELTSLPVRDVLWARPLEEAMPGDEQCGMALLRRYLHENFRLVRRFEPGDELWERKTD